MAHIKPAPSTNIESTRNLTGLSGAAPIGICDSGLTLSMNNTAFKKLPRTASSRWLLTSGENSLL
jgi:hypothetical protein